MKKNKNNILYMKKKYLEKIKINNNNRIIIIMKKIKMMIILTLKFLKKWKI